MTEINLDDYEDLNGEARRARRMKANHKPKVDKWAATVRSYETNATRRDELRISVTATAQEMDWITEHLSEFYFNKLITDVTRRVKGGKEANVYMCSGHPASGHDLIAAKLYRPRKFRSLKNTTQYEQGRVLITADGTPIDPKDRRLQKAIAGRSRKGLEVIQTSWLSYEYTLLQTLHWAGADVPEPIKHSEYALLMEYIGDRSMPAPVLIDVTLEPAEAKLLFDRMIWNIELMLRGGCVHGDLSAYNVLYWEGELCIIDFPQVVDPQANPDARFIFKRDVERICQYFERFGVQSDSRRLATDLWKKCVARKEVLA